ncbi:hypothetical protein V495_03951 [Pseudogymnoascus sp. VKM F-4514 (FW-929)]|nr:hypothetical protein V495_03951 [Pseudogymnoascus sp. VKM F-4514 (FW-929)]KFY62862.1 hypothetical protein V497_02193 [Pseudogymnoascus sp. VKM F-4516 (FW-969)]
MGHCPCGAIGKALGRDTPRGRREAPGSRRGALGSGREAKIRNYIEAKLMTSVLAARRVPVTAASRCYAWVLTAIHL